nr:unnamed protein product [Digitaria exilis]
MCVDFLYVHQQRVPPLADSSTAGAIPATTTGTTLPAAAGTTTAAAAEALQSSSPPATPSAAESTSSSTAPKKFPLPNPGVEPQPVVEPHPGVEPHIGGGGEPYNPAAEVASALPVPTPDELPSGASLGFGDHGEGVLGYGGPGDACCGGPGGYGWFGGPGGFGPGTYGYNGPLYWGAAPVTAANVVVPLLLACVAVAVLA